MRAFDPDLRMSQAFVLNELVAMMATPQWMGASLLSRGGGLALAQGILGLGHIPCDAPDAGDRHPDRGRGRYPSDHQDSDVEHATMGAWGSGAASGVDLRSPASSRGCSRSRRVMRVGGAQRQRLLRREPRLAQRRAVAVSVAEDDDPRVRTDPGIQQEAPVEPRVRVADVPAVDDPRPVGRPRRLAHECHVVLDRAGDAQAPQLH